MDILTNCSVCLCNEPEMIKCSKFNCNNKICKDCINSMVEFCSGNFKVMPCCVCESEYLYRQIGFYLSDKNVQLYNNICKQRLDELYQEKSRTQIEKSQLRLQTLELLNKFKQDLRAKLNVLSPAVAKLIEISGLEKKLIAVQKENARQNAIAVAKQANKCVSFVCKGILVDEDRFSRCLICNIKICLQCKCTYGLDHMCKKEEIESVNIIKKIAKCPRCQKPAVRDEGCVFITCPYCNVNFDSNTGEQTSEGGHNNGTLIGSTENKSLTELVIDPQMKLKLALIEKWKPTQVRSKHPAIRYEQYINQKLYTNCINLIYEYRDNGSLNYQILKDMLFYVKHLTQK